MAPSLRVTEVRIHHLSARLSERFGWSLGWTQERHGTLVEVRTDAGLTGWGDGGYGGEQLQHSPDKVIGRSPFEAEAIFDSLREPGGPQARANSATSGGLDVALWDLMGQALGLPVHRLLGRSRRKTVRPYCTALYRREVPDLRIALAEEATAWVARGFRILKLKTGYSPDTDLQLIRAVREAVGLNVGLAIDSNCAYDAGTAAMLARRLEPFNILWWEEPILAQDHEGYSRLRAAASMPLASGESLPTDSLIEHYIQPRLVDILQPDLEFTGFTGARRLTHLAWLRHMRLMPHCWGTSIRTLASLHWAAVIPPLTEALYAPPQLIEFDRTEHPFRDAIVKDPVEVGVDGMLAIPDKPGLGLRINEAAIERFRTALTVIK